MQSPFMQQQQQQQLQHHQRQQQLQFLANALQLQSQLKAHTQNRPGVTTPGMCSPLQPQLAGHVTSQL